MPKRNTLFIALLGLGLMTAAPAQSPPSRVTLGTTTVDAPHFRLAGGDLLLFGGVTLTSPDYDIKAVEVKIFDVLAKADSHEDKKRTRPPFSKITAEGDLAHGIQVIGHFTQTELTRYYTMQADHAVYMPDDSRPGGGKMDFIGHATMTVRDDKVLNDPSVTTADKITVLLGKGADYPQIAGENGHMIFTPVQEKTPVPSQP